MGVCHSIFMDNTFPSMNNRVLFLRYEEITSRKFLGKRQRPDISDRDEGDTGEQFLERGNTVILKKDKDGFMKPTYH